MSLGVFKRVVVLTIGGSQALPDSHAGQDACRGASLAEEAPSRGRRDAPPSQPATLL